MDDVDTLNLVLLVVRVAAGVTLALHGYQKFFMGGRIPGTARWFESLGMRPGKMHAYLAACTEISCGLGFAAGFLTPLTAAGFVGLMIVAAWTHKETPDVAGVLSPRETIVTRIAHRQGAGSRPLDQAHGGSDPIPPVTRGRIDQVPSATSGR